MSGPTPPMRRPVHRLIHRLKKQYWYLQNRVLKKRQCMQLISIPLFALPEEKYVEAFLQAGIQRAGIAPEQGLIPEVMLRRKISLNIIFAVLLFVYVSLFFFHFPMITYVLGFLILAVYGFVRLVSADEIFEKKKSNPDPRRKSPTLS